MPGPAKRQQMTTLGALLLVILLLFGLCGVAFASQDPQRRGISVRRGRTARPSSSATQHSEQGLTLAYSLLIPGLSGDGEPVVPDRVFRNGDRLRIEIESNEDAYLYVFDQEDNGDLVLVFPDLRLRHGIARLAADAPLILPASGPEPSAWFTLSGSPVRERFMMILSKTPIARFPSEEALLNFPEGFKLSRPEFDDLTSESEGTVDAPLGRTVLAPSRLRKSEKARGAKVATKQRNASVTVRSLVGMHRVTAQVELRIK